MISVLCRSIGEAEGQCDATVVFFFFLRRKLVTLVSTLTKKDTVIASSREQRNKQLFNPSDQLFS